MSDLSKLKVRIVDNGLFPFIGSRLAKDFGVVEYFMDYKGPDQEADKFQIGQLPGVKRIGELFHDKDSVDLWFFGDAGNGDLQRTLRAEGRIVFGTGGKEHDSEEDEKEVINGERMEFDRAWFREQIKKFGLEPIPYKIVNSIEELRDNLKKAVEKWVKLSRFRAVGETFYAKNYAWADVEIKRIAAKLGSWEKFQFIIEDSFEGMEIAADWKLCNGVHLPVGLYGWESKNRAYLGKVMNFNDLPAPVLEVENKLSPLYIEMDYTGPIAIESRIGKDLIPHPIDPACRFGSPPGECDPVIWENFSEIIWSLANEEMIAPKHTAKYVAQLIMYSDKIVHDQMPIDFPKEIADRVMLRNVTCVDGQHYLIPVNQNKIVGSVIGKGNTREEAEMECLDLVEQIEAPDLYYSESVFDALDEKLEKAGKMGIGFK